MTPKPFVRRRQPAAPDPKDAPPEPEPEVVSDLEAARRRKRREDELRAEGKPTLSAALGDLLKARDR